MSTEPISDLGKRLVIPDRAPDDGFVLRIDRMIDVEAADRAAARARWEEIVVEILAAGALFLAARQLLAIGDGAAALFMPLLSGIGWVAPVAGTLFLLLSLLASDGRASRLSGRTPFG